jgi:hypothetical protein
MSDSYARFFKYSKISKEDFFEFGLSETIYAPYEKAEAEWKKLKQKIENNEKTYIRGFGRDAKGTHLFQELYKHLVGNYKVTKDPTNNAEPSKIIRELTGYSKTKNNKHKQISNYQISHIFGRTKNVYAFAAPWNIVYIPKILDPFTGHEAKGEMVDEFTNKFQKQGYNKFCKLIEDFNEIMSKNSFKEKMEEGIGNIEKSGKFEEKIIAKLRESVLSEFSPITVN